MPQKIGLATLSDELIDYLVKEGFRWSDENQCWQMPHEQFVKWNNKMTPLGKMSFEVDHFHMAVHKPYGGDCKMKLHNDEAKSD